FQKYRFCAPKAAAAKRCDFVCHERVLRREFLLTKRARSQWPAQAVGEPFAVGARLRPHDSTYSIFATPGTRGVCRLASSRQKHVLSRPTRGFARAGQQRSAAQQPPPGATPTA